MRFCESALEVTPQPASFASLHNHMTMLGLYNLVRKAESDNPGIE